MGPSLLYCGFFRTASVFEKPIGKLENHKHEISLLLRSEAMSQTESRWCDLARVGDV